MHALVFGPQRFTSCRRNGEKRDIAHSETLGLRQGPLLCTSAGGQALQIWRGTLAHAVPCASVWVLRAG